MEPTAKVHLASLSKWRGVPQWRLTVTDPRGTERELKLMSGVSWRIGTNPANDIVVQDDTVSRAHAELTGEADGARLRDLGSTNGCWFNGARVHELVLRAGVVTLGTGTRITVATDEAVLEALEPVDHFGPLLGRSPPMRALFKALTQLATSSSTVLIQAESGTGKELVARALYEQGERRSGPYVVFDCAAVAPSLIESALFGHEKGAFTGATSRKLGCFEEANEGTLLLDEIGELPLELQPRLLRALENREIRRVGGSTPIPISVRLVAATHRDLARWVNTGQFREDLYYRLAVVRLRIPPLRERMEDLRLLVEHLMVQACAGDARKAAALMGAIDDAHWAELRRHTWPGNVRELRNAVERAVATGSPLSLVHDLVPSALAPTPPANEVDLDAPFVEQRQQLLERFEKQYLQSMIDRHRGNVSRAAAGAGLDRMYFKRLLAKWGLSKVPADD